MNSIKKFNLEREKYIKQLGNSKRLKKIAWDFFIESWKLKYSYNFNWLGRPIIQYPQDVVALQEIVWAVKPDLIIETGIAHGGSLIFYASLLEMLGRGEVVGIDIDIRQHNRQEIVKHPMFKRIKLIEGSSLDEKVASRVEKIAKKHKKILVVLDSMHTGSHVFQELEIYSKFVTVGSYIVVMDTFIGLAPAKLFFNRPWNKNDNPLTAVRSFLKKNKNFIVDKKIEDKILITAAPSGYLQRIK